jgi:hypothetical protein
MSTFATQDKKPKFLLLVFMAVALIELIVILFLLSKLARLEDRTTYPPYEKIYVEKSIGQFAKENHASVETVMSGRFAVLTRTDTGRCVNIRPVAGAIGYVAIYCFDDSGRLTFKGKV